jgi:1,2-phenylacetyl-CoA epoxidase PaaB subunit
MYYEVLQVSVLSTDHHQAINTQKHKYVRREILIILYK